MFPAWLVLILTHKEKSAFASGSASQGSISIPLKVISLSFPSKTTSSIFGRKF
jgi:hypothetical protein